MSFDELKNRSRPEQKKNMFSDSPEFSAMSHGKAIATFRRSITHTHKNVAHQQQKSHKAYHKFIVKV